MPSETYKTPFPVNEVVGFLEDKTIVLREDGVVFYTPVPKGILSIGEAVEADSLSIMLQSKLGIDITDSRKLHLKNHFNILSNFINELENKPPSKLTDDLKSTTGIDKAFKTVSEKYKGLVEDITPYLKNSLEQNYEPSQRQISAQQNTQPTQSFNIKMQM